MGSKFGGTPLPALSRTTTYINTINKSTTARHLAVSLLV